MRFDSQLQTILLLYSEIEVKIKPGVLLRRFNTWMPNPQKCMCMETQGLPEGSPRLEAEVIGQEMRTCFLLRSFMDRSTIETALLVG